MNKIILSIIVIIMITGSAGALEKQHLARLHFDGGGDWYNDSDALPNLVKYLNENIHTDFALEQAVVKPLDNDIFNYPFIFMTGHGQAVISDKEAENLRNYLLRGGFLYIDDDYGLDESVRRFMHQIFPEYNLVELPASHEIYHSYHHFDQGLPKIHKHDDKRPQGFAIFDDNGRMLVFYTYESNISDGWSDAHDDPETIKESAFRMGLNLFYYIMSS